MPARRREEFSQKIRREARKRSGGRCERCGKVLWPGDGRVFDHIVACYFGGKGTLENCQLICVDCDKPKTRNDQKTIAKSKRLVQRHQKHLERMRLKGQVHAQARHQNPRRAVWPARRPGAASRRWGKRAG